MSSSGHRPRIAFQGERGAFSEEAAFNLLGTDIDLVPRPTFKQLFESIEEGVADFVLAPIENTLVGPINAVANLLERTQLKIVSEVTIQIAQQLIGCRGSVFEQIQTVESHPAALAQCKQFFAQHPQILKVESEDTAGSVARIVKLGDRTRAAIAGRRAAELYGGLILKENLQDKPENYTRFLLLKLVEVQSNDSKHVITRN